MPQKYETTDQPVAAFGIGKIRRHLFVCIGPDCVDADAGNATWEYVKRRMKELNIAGPDGPCYRTKCNCLRICTAGPTAVVYPEGAWYRDVTPSMAGRTTKDPWTAGGMVRTSGLRRNP